MPQLFRRRSQPITARAALADAGALIDEFADGPFNRQVSSRVDLLLALADHLYDEDRI